jgi:hypothetical protein
MASLVENKGLLLDAIHKCEQKKALLVVEPKFQRKLQTLLQAMAADLGNFQAHLRAIEEMKSKEAGDGLAKGVADMNAMFAKVQRYHLTRQALRSTLAQLQERYEKTTADSKDSKTTNAN